MKVQVLFAIFLLITTASVAQDQGYGFKDIMRLDVNEVESQGRTGTCWSFSSTSFLESEVLRNGGPAIDLSEMFAVRMTYPLKAVKYLRYHGKNNFSEGSLNHDVFNCLKLYGAVPESAYFGKTDSRGKHNHSKMVKLLSSYLEAVLKQGEIGPEWKAGFEAILDAYLGDVPENFVYEGKEYTPRRFADEILNINAEDYVSLTSFSHHPLYSEFILEIPDNFSNGTYHNVSLKDLETVADEALKNGYTLAWDADVSDAGFSARSGIAIKPAIAWNDMSAEEKKEAFSEPVEEILVSEEERQEMFDSHVLTDDHLMHIVGMAMDKNGSEYYIVKNSWGNSISFDGYMYVSKAYFRMNTIAIILHKDGVAKSVRKNLALN